MFVCFSFFLYFPSFNSLPFLAPQILALPAHPNRQKSFRFLDPKSSPGSHTTGLGNSTKVSWVLLLPIYLFSPFLEEGVGVGEKDDENDDDVKQVGWKA